MGGNRALDPEQTFAYPPVDRIVERIDELVDVDISVRFGAVNTGYVAA